MYVKRESSGSVKFALLEKEVDVHTYIATYIIIGHYNPSVRITTWLTTPLILCALILYMSGGTYSLKSTPNDKFYLRNFS